MKIVVTGTRGIPNILGGVETHCEELYPRIVKMGHDVTIIRRSCYVREDNKLGEYKGIRLIDVFAPKKKSIEAIIHTFLAIIKARSLNADVVHIHAIGPSIMTPFAKLLGLKVVTTNHGPDYDRDKWGKLAKAVLKTGEYLGTKFSDRVIVISKVIASILEDRYNRRDSVLIYNGVTPPIKSKNTDYIESFGLKPKKYIVALGRFVKEKNFHQLIEAYTQSNTKDFQLVIAGDADHEDEYSLSLKKLAKDNNVILTGFIKGERLNQILTNAALFVLPSSHEGLPISLLEAMSYNIDVLVSDIPANTLDVLKKSDFFKVNDIDSLKKALETKIHNSEHLTHREYELGEYDWDRIAEQTLKVYESVVKKYTQTIYDSTSLKSTSTK